MLFIALGAVPVDGQDLVVSGGDLVTEDGSGNQVFRLDSSGPEAEVGGDGRHGKLSALDASGTSAVLCEHR